MSACISKKNFTKLSAHVSCGRGSVLLWRQLCTSGFVDNVKTSYFHIVGQMQIQVWSLWRSELFIGTRQMAPLNSASWGEVSSRRLPRFSLQSYVASVMLQRVGLPYRGHGLNHSSNSPDKLKIVWNAIRECSHSCFIVCHSVRVFYASLTLFSIITGIAMQVTEFGPNLDSIFLNIP